MGRRGALATRSSAAKAATAILLLAGVVLAGWSVTFSAAQIAVRSNPSLAYRLAPYDGRITADFAESLVGEDATADDRRHADLLAREALRHDPTAVDAVTSLGLDAGFRGDMNGAQKFFSYAESLSRRDQKTQLWAIEYAVANGNIATALRHYDIVLRVRPTMSDLLFPVLTSAIGNPPVREALARTLAARPAWADRLVTFVATYSVDPRVGAQLLIDLKRRGSPVSQAAQASMIASLIARGGADAAWSYYSTLHPGSDRRRSRDSDFKAGLDAPSMLDWVPVNDNGIISSIHDGIFEFSTPPSVGGALLNQTQFLVPGNYVLTGESRGVSDSDNPPYWTLMCQGGREIGRIGVPASAGAEGRFEGRVEVPTGCPVQILTLVAQPSDSASGLSGEVSRVQLAPAR